VPLQVIANPDQKPPKIAIPINQGGNHGGSDQRDTYGINSPRVMERKPVVVNQNSAKSLLPAQKPGREGRKCLVLDLDETLVHSSFQPVDKYDFLIPVEIDGNTYQVYVAKRPHVDEFLKEMGKVYEVVVFTASLSKYADPVLDLLDIHRVVDFRLFREHCTDVDGTYVKDLSLLARPLNRICIVDNSPIAYSFHPENAIAIQSWFEDTRDSELLKLIPMLQTLASQACIYEHLAAHSTESKRSQPQHGR